MIDESKLEDREKTLNDIVKAVRTIDDNAYFVLRDDLEFADKSDVCIICTKDREDYNLYTTSIDGNDNSPYHRECVNSLIFLKNLKPEEDPVKVFYPVAIFEQNLFFFE